MGNSANILVLPETLTLYLNPQTKHNSLYILKTES